jgi:steroid 5-alpha reductase family enzyme
MSNCVHTSDWQKAFDHVNWTKLMQILKGPGIEWHRRRLISILYMVWSVKLKMDQRSIRIVKIGRGVREGCCLLPILFNLYSV